MKKPAFVLFILFLTMTACSHRKVFEKYDLIDNMAWNRFSPVKFEFPVDDTTVGYELTMVIRHTPDMKYNALNFESAIYAPDGEVRIRDSRMRIKDNEGNLLGKNMGDYWEVEYPLRKDLKFNAMGNCSVEINSSMSTLDIVGITEIGLVVRKD